MARQDNIMVLSENRFFGGKRFYDNGKTAAELLEKESQLLSWQIDKKPYEARKQPKSTIETIREYRRCSNA